MGIWRGNGGGHWIGIMVLRCMVKLMYMVANCGDAVIYVGEMLQCDAK